MLSSDDKAEWYGNKCSKKQNIWVNIYVKHTEVILQSEIIKQISRQEVNKKHFESFCFATSF